jgi:hypothetical protein
MKVSAKNLEVGKRESPMIEENGFSVNSMHLVLHDVRSI